MYGVYNRISQKLRSCIITTKALLVFLSVGLGVPVTGWADQSSASRLDLGQIQVLDLQTAVNITMTANTSLAAARDRALQAAAAVKQAQSAYWPRVDLQVGGSWVDLSENELAIQEANLQMPQMIVDTLIAEMAPPGTPSPDLGFPTTINDPEYYYNAGLSVTWLIFNGFARKFSLAAARYGEKASIQSHQDTRRTLLSAVIYAYLEAQLAKENIAIAQADEAFNSRLLTEARLRYDVGAGALSDVLNFQVLGNASQTQIIQFELAYQNALIGLAVLMNAPLGKLPDHIRLAELEPTTAIVLESLQSEDLIKKAHEQRPDIQQLEMAVKAAEASIKAAKGEYYPTLALNAGYEGTRAEDLAFDGDDFGGTIALGLSWNLFTGGLTKARISEVRAKLSEMQNTLNSARMAVAKDVQGMVALIRSLQSQLVLQEASTELVQQQRDLVEKEYKSGVGSLVRLNEAQLQLTRAQGQLVLARVKLWQAWYNLQAGTGRILEMF